ncbi:hypothetical protein Q4E93_09200 [Flavitalea sp. BT771]|uniref:hypothetical protein n=1 Tax=Flavitalea sp. BT771 TaxID=3063329 RepID=UPI0026E44010|nr:hypothetical protein [Flavitalea sp. BT771]MDO6430764.1 hypothetical protein [Flavitalea sp. BT771]MDV6219096.1 hypothetical protein [Flavitalea sp. BT771]
MIRKIKHAIGTFFFTPAGSFNFSFLRIGTALFILLQFVFLYRSWFDIYGEEGYIEWFISKDLFSIGFLPSVITVAGWLKPLHITPDQTLTLISILYFLSAVAMLVGWRRRLAVVTAFILHLTLCNTSMIFGYGVETFTHIALFYLIFVPGRASGKATAFNNFIWRTLQIHLCLVYLNSGVAKLQGVDWRMGEAVWYTLGNSNYGNFNLLWLSKFPLVLRSVNWWVLLIETLYPIFIWPKRTRKFWLFNVLALHFFIGLFMGLYMFGVIMMILNTAAFLHFSRIRAAVTLPDPEQADTILHPTVEV